MELLLNLIWISLALLALVGFSRGRSVSGQLARVPYRKSLIAVGCVMVLLFPIISASDDLHPTQAVVEEASKRVQRAVAPLHGSPGSPPASTLAVVLALCAECSRWLRCGRGAHWLPWNSRLRGRLSPPPGGPLLPPGKGESAHECAVIDRKYSVRVPYFCRSGTGALADKFLPLVQADMPGPRKETSE